MPSLPYTKIRKRDGRITDFEPERITLAADKALRAIGTANHKLAKTICNDVLKSLVSCKDKVDIPDIELVQDLVESAFIRRSLTEAAKSYILYRAQHQNLRKKPPAFNGYSGSCWFLS